MIEIILKQYLEKKLKKTVLLEHENDEPTQFFLIQKTSGGFDNQISSATFAMQSYADSKYNAALMNVELKKAMLQVIELNEIASVKLNSDYDFTDTESKKYRYQAVFDINYY